MKNMKSRSLLLSTVLASAFMFSGSAKAAVLISGPLPSNTFISFGGFEWAWVNNFAFDSSSANFDLGPQSVFGWRLPTLDELALAPSAADFQFDGANVPFGSADPVSGAIFNATSGATVPLTGDAACATPYFSLNNSCNWRDAGNYLDDRAWAGNEGYESWWDTVVIRDVVSSEVPLPATFALISLGLLGLRLRRK